MNDQRKIALWCLTPKGFELAVRIAGNMEFSDIFVSKRLAKQGRFPGFSRPFNVFEKLGPEVEKVFHRYWGHLFIMATGIVVRTIAPILSSKLTDPAVVVIDELGKHAISLISGHIGGANHFAVCIARIVGAEPVITTATDSNRLPSIDTLAARHGLVIENPQVVKHINMAFLTGKKPYLFDPVGILGNRLEPFVINLDRFVEKPEKSMGTDRNMPCICISDRSYQLDEIPFNLILFLRPKTLVAGIGCNRGTEKSEIKEFLIEVIQESGLSPLSLQKLATADIKRDEKGLLALSRELNTPVDFFSKSELNSIKRIENPSNTVFKHIGVKSVCEASAMLSANTDKLLAPKKKKGNVTIALVKTTSGLSE